MPQMIGAIVLAAGTSSRMGQPKHALPFGDTTVLGSVLEAALAAHLAQIVVVATPTSARVVQSVAGVELVLNPEPERGLSYSIQLGLQRLRDDIDGVAVLMGDQPGITPALLNRLIAAFEESRADAVRPVYSGTRGTPALLSRSLYPLALRLKGDMGMRQVLETLRNRVVEVEVGHLGRGLDIDTLEDYQSLLAGHADACD